MPLDANVVRQLTTASVEEAWRVIIDNVIEIAARPLSKGNASSEIIKRDRNQLLCELRVYRRISDKPGTDNAVIHLRHPGCARVAQPGDLHWRRLKGKRR